MQQVDMRQPSLELYLAIPRIPALCHIVHVSRSGKKVASQLFALRFTRVLASFKDEQFTFTVKK